MRMSIGYLEPLVFIFFGVTFMHANLCMHILALTCRDGGNPFPVFRLPVLNSVTDSSRHTLLLPTLHGHVRYTLYTNVSLASLWFRSPHVRMRKSIGYLEPLICLFFRVTFVHANLCQSANFCNFAKNYK